VGEHHRATRQQAAQAWPAVHYLVNKPDPVLEGEELRTFRFVLEKSEGKTLGGGYGKEATLKQLSISRLYLSQEMNGDATEPGTVSGLTKTEAEDLLDCLEAAGYGPCQLSYVDGEGFSIRLPFGSKSTARSKG
jgi:hypothetical protein